MKSARLLLGLVCGAMCVALFSGCETQQSACEREKRLTQRMDELQMDLDGRIQGVNMEMAGMRANPPVVVQQVPMPTIPDTYATAPAVQEDTIQIDNNWQRLELERLAEESRRQQLSAAYEPPPQRSGVSNAAKHIRVPVPVRTVQAALKAAGFYNGAVDGKVGRQTIAAITAFQRSEGLKADGIVGRQTWARLEGHAPAGMSTRRLK